MQPGTPWKITLYTLDGEDGLSMVSSTGTPEAAKKSLVITSLYRQKALSSPMIWSSTGWFHPASTISSASPGSMGISQRALPLDGSITLPPSYTIAGRDEPIPLIWVMAVARIRPVATMRLQPFSLRRTQARSTSGDTDSPRERVSSISVTRSLNAIVSLSNRKKGGLVDPPCSQGGGGPPSFSSPRGRRSGMRVDSISSQRFS